MSTRWYPLYQRGNPQLRVFLPNFWLKLVEPEHKQPTNVVTFHCSMEMTKFDVQNYLEKIYNVHPVKVNTRIALGKTKQGRTRLVKEDDIKIAYVTLPKNEEFIFPKLFTESTESDTMTEQLKKAYIEFKNRSKAPSLPSWFTL